MRTQEDWINYYHESRDLKKIPNEYITKEMCEDYFARTNDIANIPGKYITNKMCEDYFARTHNIELIPEEFVTRKMCEIYLEKGGYIDYVPREFLDQEMYNLIFKIKGVLHLIPSKFRTKEMCEKYFRNTANISFIPKEYITLEMCIAYYLKFKKLDSVPDKFIGQDFFDRIFALKHEISLIPIEYMTQEMCEDYFDRTGRIEGIPTKFLKGKIKVQFETYKRVVLAYYDELPENIGDLEKLYFAIVNCYINDIPTILVNDKLLKRVLVVRKDLRYIPSSLRNRDTYLLYFILTDNFSLIEKTGYAPSPLIVDYLVKTGKFNKIPKKFRTAEIGYKVFNQTHDLVSIPEDMRSKKLYEKHFELTGKVDLIPFEYYNQSMYIAYFNQTHDLSKVPFEYYNEEMLKVYLENNGIKDLPLTDHILKQFKNNTKLFKYLNEEEKEVIIGKLDENKMANSYAAITFERLDYLRILVSSFGKIDRNGLTLEQKIKFAYNLYSKKPDRDISELYKWLKKYRSEDEDFAETIRFFDYVLGYKDFEIKSPREQETIKSRRKWLHDYSIDYQFRNDLKLSIMTNNGVVAFEKEDVEKVIRKMQLHGIPTINCLVNAAIRSYANGDSELDDFAAGLELMSVEPSTMTVAHEKVLVKK